MVTAAQALDVTVGALVDELARAGVHHVCICPGSRSTPLALKMAEHPTIRVWMHLDERSAAYFGLGLARALRAPVGLVATSGTAAANFLPAVVEAFYSRVPLVVLTADRPHELRDVGASQTIDQLRLYGQHVKWFFDLPEPDAAPEPQAVRHIRSLAGRAVATAVAEPAGPVHLNCPLREPLIPEPMPEPAAWGARASSRPYVRASSGPRAPSPELVAELAADLAERPRGLIVCGPQDDPRLPVEVAALATHLGYPILADPLSGVRYGLHDRSLVLDAYDAWLRVPDVADRLTPEVILRFGAAPTSKAVLLHLQRVSAARHILVDGGGGWREPTALASDVVHADGRLLAHALRAAAAPAARQADWAADWVRVDRTTRAAIRDHLDSLDELFEGKVFPTLGSLLPDRATLYVGNSMPVRDLDTFLPATDRAWRVLANRGASGIDGVVSSAFGARAAALPGPVVLVIGDLSLYHDMNGLLAARRHGLDLLVVLLNNNGGGIFSFLPQAAHPRHFEELFGTPHGLDFRPFVEGYGGRFTRVDGWSTLSATVADALERGGLVVVEVPTDRQRNVELHRESWQAVAAALARAPVAAG